MEWNSRKAQLQINRGNQSGSRARAFASEGEVWSLPAFGRSHPGHLWAYWEASGSLSVHSTEAGITLLEYWRQNDPCRWGWQAFKVGDTDPSWTRFHNLPKPCLLYFHQILFSWVPEKRTHSLGKKARYSVIKTSFTSLFLALTPLHTYRSLPTSIAPRQERGFGEGRCEPYVCF